jgi:hypothetical protein
MSADLLDQRILGALRFVHGVTGTPLAREFSLTAPGVRWLRNRSGHYVMADVPGLETHTASFDAPPVLPPLGSLTLDIDIADPSGEFLPRTAQVRLPRDPDPARADTPDSLFRAHDIALYPAPVAHADHDWARLRAAVRAPGGTPAAFALLRVVRVSDASLLARAMSDARGEALIAVAGIPVTAWDEADGPVLGTDIEVRIEAFHDPDVTDSPDPDDLEARRADLASASVVLRIAAGRTQSLVIQLAPSP